MTEKENEAIEDLKDILKYWQTIVDIEDDVEREIEMNCYFEEMPFKQLKIALNLIEKKQKEIEELRQNYDTATTKTEELKKKLGLKQFDVNVVYNDYLEKLREFKSNSIPKDKIRKEIGEQVNKMLEFVKCNAKQEFDECNYCKIILEKLLEEE